MSHAGTTFSRRPAAILALLAVYTGSVVRNQAKRWLEHIKVPPSPALRVVSAPTSMEM